MPKVIWLDDVVQVQLLQPRPPWKIEASYLGLDKVFNCLLLLELQTQVDVMTLMAR